MDIRYWEMFTFCEKYFLGYVEVLMYMNCFEHNSIVGTLFAWRRDIKIIKLNTADIRYLIAIQELLCKFHITLYITLHCRYWHEISQHIHVLKKIILRIICFSYDQEILISIKKLIVKISLLQYDHYDDAFDQGC